MRKALYNVLVVALLLCSLASGLATHMGHATSAAASTSSDSTDTIFDDFSVGIGAWWLSGSVSAAQDSGNTFMRFTPAAQSAAEASRDTSNVSLAPYTAIKLRINLHGATLADNDGSALYLDQGGWKYVGLSHYVNQGVTGWQNISVPLSDFVGFDKTASFARLGFRFWVPTASTIDVDDIIFSGTGTASTATPSASAVPTAPTPTLTTATTNTLRWPIQSVDSMKETKDRLCNERDGAWIDHWLDKAVELGVNYVTVDTPYDNPPCGGTVVDAVAYAKTWVQKIRARGLHVWHRHTPLAWQGGQDGYGVPKDNTIDYTSLITTYIKNNPSLFQPGDIFSPIPEPQNGGIYGVEYCGPTGICQFPNKETFNAWLRNVMTASRQALQDIGVQGVKVGYFGFDGFVAWGDANPDWLGKSFLEPATVAAMDNVITYLIEKSGARPRRASRGRGPRPRVG